MDPWQAVISTTNLSFSMKYLCIFTHFIGGPPRRSPGQGHPPQILRANHIHSHNHMHSELDSASISSSHFDIDWEAKEVYII